MTRSVPSRRRETPRSHRSVTARTCAIVLAVTLSAALLSGYSLRAPESSALAGSSVPLSVLAVAVGAVLVALGLIVLRVRRRKARLEATLDWIQGYEVSEQTFLDHPELERRRSGAESLALRTLRAQVRTLEQALEQEQARPDATLTAPGAAEVADFHRDVTLTLRAIARRTPEGEDPRRSLARAAAAVDRLRAPNTFARPVLSPAAPLALPAARTAQPQVAAPPAVPAAASAAAPQVDETAELPAADAEAPAEQTLAAPAQPEPEVVLPVPPPRNDDAQRGRRWFRRSAA